jgi:hypothetical protein
MQGQNIQKFWNEERQQRLDELRAADTVKEKQEAVRNIMKFNVDIRKSQAIGLVSLITAETIRKATVDKPNKKQTSWLKQNVIK